MTLKKALKISIKTIIILLILALLVIPPIYLPNAVGYVPGLLVLFILLFSALYMFLLKASLSFEVSFDESSVKRKEKAPFQVTLKNKFFLIFPRIEANFYLTDTYANPIKSEKLFVSLSPFEKRQIDFDVYFEHIGSFKTGLNEVRVYDPFCIFSLRVTADAAYNVDVIPRTFDIASLDMSNQAMNESDRSRIVTNYDSSDYSGVRDYAPGDLLKSIHWKLSAHSNDVYTKILESYATCGLSVVIDLFSKEKGSELCMNYFDAILETAVSLCSYARKTGHDYDIRFFNRDGVEKIVILKNDDSLYELIKELAPITNNESIYETKTLISGASRGRYAKNNIAICTSNLSDDILHAISDLKAGKLNPSLFYIVKPTMNEREVEDEKAKLRVLDNIDVKYYMFSDADYLE